MEDKEQLSQEPIVDTENGAETAPETEEAPLSEIDQFKADLADQKDKYLRLMAEFENFKRRTAKERVDLIQTAGKDVIVSLLDVMDDCDRAEKQLNGSDDIAVQKEGIQLVFNKIRTTLHAKGLKAMESIARDHGVEIILNEEVAAPAGYAFYSLDEVEVLPKPILIEKYLKSSAFSPEK